MPNARSAPAPNPWSKAEKGNAGQTGPRRGRAVGAVGQAGRRAEGGRVGRKAAGRRKHRSPSRPAATRRRKGEARARTGKASQGEIHRAESQGKERPGGRTSLPVKADEGGDGPGRLPFRPIGQPAARPGRGRSHRGGYPERGAKRREADRSRPRPRLGKSRRGEFAEGDRRRRSIGPQRHCRPASASRPSAKSATRPSGWRRWPIRSRRRGTASPSRSSKRCWRPKRRRPSFRRSSASPSPRMRKGKSKRRWATCKARWRRCAARITISQREANALADAIEGGSSGRVGWRPTRQGYFESAGALCVGRPARRPRPAGADPGVDPQGRDFGSGPAGSRAVPQEG